MRTIDQYMRDCIAKGIIDFSVRASVNPDVELVTFYIRPDSKDGDTIDFEVSGNHLFTLADPSEIA